MQTRLEILERIIIKIIEGLTSITGLFLSNEKTMEFLKFLLGTFILGYASITINADYQNAQLQQKIRENEQKFCQQFIDRFVQAPLVERIEFAEYFAYVLGGRWEKYYSILENNYKSRIKELERANRLLAIQKITGPLNSFTEIFSGKTSIATETAEMLETKIQQIQQTTLSPAMQTQRIDIPPQSFMRSRGQ